MGACIYLRIAGINRNTNEQLTAQGNDLESYCGRNGLFLDRVYQELGISGLTPIEEPLFAKQLLADARKGVLDCLLVERLDRLSRDSWAMFNIVSTLKSCGVRVISVSERLVGVDSILPLLDRSARRS